MANGGIIGTVNTPTSTTATGVWQQEEQYEAKVTDTWPQRTLFTTKSLRFNRGSSDNLSRTKGTSTSTTKGTYSFWFKLSKTTGLTLIENGTAAADRAIVYIQSDSTLKLFSKIGNSTKLDLGTNRVFRDTSAWYNVVISIDTTQGTDTNRVKLYVNGTQETSFASSTYPAQNDALRFFTSSEIEEIGIDFENGGLFDGYMSEVIKIDGQQLAPTSFGVTNSDGVWTPIIYSGTYGNNGFNLQFENAAALGTDSSPNGNTFTVNNLTSIDQSTDYPVVNYATLNPLATGSLITLSEGNLKATGNNASDSSTTTATIGITSGKFYWETKIVNIVSGYPYLGIYKDFDSLVQGNLQGGATGDRVMTVYIAGGSTTLVKPGTNLTITAPANDNIIMFAVDKDNNKFYMGVNGTWYNSGNPTSGATGTGSLADLDANGVVMFGSHNYNNSAIELNFGSPSFAISSGNTDGNGYGNFEYAVPSGYYSLNTKNLGEFG